MSSKKLYFAYIRVSTVRQGQFGTSLVEQRAAIERHARQKNLHIIKEFQEQDTAAKGGRPVFRALMQALQEKKAAGVVMHKIDRGARNLKDWAELGEIIDAGIEVHFANENVDMYSRGGRLSADIQAVVAADYIRNLREEVKKGFYGRIKQGYYPMPAPIGYLNQGGGKVKAVDHLFAPLIRQAFELYASGRYSLASLTDKMRRLGLHRKSALAPSVNGMSKILHNVFYVGIIHIKILDEYFLGRHEPIVSKELFDKVQAALARKMSKTAYRSVLHETFLFRKLLICKTCDHHLVGERHKGHHYYRCHSRSCAGATIREEKIRTSLWSTLKKLEPVTKSNEGFAHWLSGRRQNLGDRIAERRKALYAELEDNRLRLESLTDALITEAIDKPAFLERKNALIAAEVALRESLAHLEIDEQQSIRQYEAAFDFLKTARLTFTYGSYARKREVIQIIVEHMVVNKRRVSIKLREPFQVILAQKKNTPDGTSN